MTTRTRTLPPMTELDNSKTVRSHRWYAGMAGVKATPRKEIWEATSADGRWCYVREDQPGTPWSIIDLTGEVQDMHDTALSHARRRTYRIANCEHEIRDLTGGRVGGIKADERLTTDLYRQCRHCCEHFPMAEEYAQARYERVEAWELREGDRFVDGTQVRSVRSFNDDVFITSDGQAREWRRKARVGILIHRRDLAV